MNINHYLLLFFFLSFVFWFFFNWFTSLIHAWDVAASGKMFPVSITWMTSGEWRMTWSWSKKKKKQNAYSRTWDPRSMLFWTIFFPCRPRALAVFRSFYPPSAHYSTVCTVCQSHSVARTCLAHVLLFSSWSSSQSNYYYYRYGYEWTRTHRVLSTVTRFCSSNTPLHLPFYSYLPKVLRTDCKDVDSVRLVTRLPHRFWCHSAPARLATSTVTKHRVGSTLTALSAG